MLCAKRRYLKPHAESFDANDGKHGVEPVKSTFLPKRLSHLRGPSPNIPGKVPPTREMCTGVQIYVQKVLARDADAIRDKCLFISRLSCAFNSRTRQHDEIAQMHRGKMWHLIHDIRSGHKLRVEECNKQESLLTLVSPCEPLVIQFNHDILSLCMQSLETSMDDDGLLDPTVYFASLNVACAGTMRMAVHKNSTGYKFFNRLLILLLESVELKEPYCDFYFKPKRKYLRNLTEICKMQETCDYSLRFNCGGYGFSRLMWASLKISTNKDLLNPWNMKRFKNSRLQI